MKKLMKLSLLLVVVALTFSSCNCFKKMAKNSDDVSLTCAPEVLVLNNGVVAADITAQFPVKYFNPKAIVKVTPVMDPSFDGYDWKKLVTRTAAQQNHFISAAGATDRRTP